MSDDHRPTSSYSWEDFLTPRDKEHLATTSWGKSKPFGLGSSPAIVVIDDYYGALGHERLPLLESVKTWPMSCGDDGWEAIDRTVELLAAARAHGVPIIYIHLIEELIKTLNTRSGSDRDDMWKIIPKEYHGKANEIVAEIAPHEGDLVLQKAGPSAFAGTPLLDHLIHQRIDTVIAVGESTSGCVRATVVDGATHRLRMAVAAECVFDRTQASHHMSLFDLDQKYGDVMSNAQLFEYFASL